MAKRQQQTAEVDYGERTAEDIAERLYFPPRSPVLMKENTGEKHQPTAELREVVIALCSLGTPQADVAKYIGVCEKTLRRHYRDEIERSGLTASMMVGKALYQACMSGNVPALIFWAKTRMGWKEEKVINHTGTPPGGAPTVNIILKGREDHSDAQMARVAILSKPALPPPEADNHG